MPSSHRRKTQYTFSDGSTNLDNGSPNSDNGSPNLDKKSPNLDEKSPNLDNGSPNLDNGPPNLDNMSPNLGNVSPNLGEYFLFLFLDLNQVGLLNPMSSSGTVRSSSRYYPYSYLGAIYYHVGSEI